MSARLLAGRGQHRPNGWRRRSASGAVGVLMVGSGVLGAGVVPAVAAAADPGAVSTAADSSRVQHRAVVVVAPSGHDRATGTVRHPLATLAAAVRRLPHGGTVLLRGGRYGQRVTLGPTAHDLTIRPYGHEHPILDGTDLTAPAGRSAMVAINGSRSVTVQGLDIRGYDTVSLDAVPIGIYVHGAARGIHLRRNHVHSMGNYNGTLGSYDLNAHGIAVYGDSAAQAIRGLVIDGNEVDHLALGASESVVVNGNVDGWRISHNDIHDNNNIGIDAIGYEPTLSGADRYTIRNRARNGVIADNTVRNIISRGNPTYYEDGSWCNCADGIYIDGGTSIRVERNRVLDSDIGIEVAAENARGSADHVVVADNFVSGSGYVGIATGGYCNGDEACGGEQTGRSHDNTFVNNTLYGNNTLADGSPEVLVQYYAYRNTFTNNVVHATGDARAVVGTVPGAERDGLSTPLRADHNLYWVTGGQPRRATFGSVGRTYPGFNAYRQATGQDRHSRFANPRLVDPAAADLHLRRSSPAVDTGARVPASLVGRFDIDHGPRVVGRGIDLGADEVRRP
jgi:hypothetical protein